MMNNKDSATAHAGQLEMTGITETEYQQLFDVFSNHITLGPDLKTYFRTKLKAYFANTKVPLSIEPEISRKLWYVVSGLVYEQHEFAGCPGVSQLFYSGEFPFLAHSFIHQKASKSSLYALPGTKIMEMSYEDVNELQILHPQGHLIINYVIAGKPGKHRAKSNLLRLSPKERIRAFHLGMADITPNPYPQIPHHIAASFLNISAPTYLKYYKHIYR